MKNDYQAHYVKTLTGYTKVYKIKLGEKSLRKGDTTVALLLFFLLWRSGTDPFTEPCMSSLWIWINPKIGFVRITPECVDENPDRASCRADVLDLTG